MRSFISFLVLISSVAAVPSKSCSTPTSLPTVDLGYEIHQAISFNVETGHYNNFSNTRYARLPTGELRFAAPQPPVKDRKTVQKGDIAEHLASCLALIFDRSVKITTAFNHNETEYFTSQDNVNNTVFVDNLKTIFPDAQSPVIDYISKELYPPSFDGSQPYKDFFTRAKMSLADAGFTRSIPYLYNGPSEVVPDSASPLALMLQRYLVPFALTGEPNTQAELDMPVYGSKGELLEFTNSGVDIISDPNNNKRCEWWQRALYF
ncbi:uncharacterized protein NECHADRAFT_88162 [Fusarium vanettenii 77-13-4]|uniref:Carboxylesterase type B domain-containing protein n=1 Tax=Fusarium vanettenii (strain ATCC MYA-4622 / CBS 123669 / FGSC 9596 / NRRL 45880 / 77-13-4) TaxID=660122 RepID=C7ZDX1_FUSV7|nr:uncharacterized protein NECHADRAFT_88162 [Fusarium vanettenii 77-13-4]EEU37881.1 hypothetical protein NECHADRAFT_88162 [Fusarium vanettenii 77-13-4]